MSPSGKYVPPPADIDPEVTQVPTATSDSASKTTNSAAWVAKFDVAHYCHQILILKVSHVTNPENYFRNTSDAHVHSLLQSFRAYGLDLARGTLSVTTSAIVNRSNAWKLSIAYLARS